MIIKTDYINDEIKKDTSAFVHQSEDDIVNQLKRAATDFIKTGSEKPLILISGPSGSGKTTTAIKLYNAIKSMGQNVCYISMDKYFKNFTPEEKALKVKGKIDLESPERVDTEFLNRDIATLLDGGKIDIPTYDFSTNQRSYTGKMLSRGGGFVIIEGIHALNPDVLGEYDEYSKRIYVSVRTRVVDSQGDKLHPCKIRLMRRMMRDKLYRGRSIEETIKMFPHVQRGENQYILPYKSRSDVDIDTFIKYEPSLYKGYLYDDICALSDKCADVRDVANALDELDTMPADIVPTDALVREFIGGSSLSY